MRYVIHVFDLLLPFSHRIKDVLYMISLLCGNSTSRPGIQGLIIVSYLIIGERPSKATLGKECNRLDNDGGGGLSVCAHFSSTTTVVLLIIIIILHAHSHTLLHDNTI